MTATFGDWKVRKVFTFGGGLSAANSGDGEQYFDQFSE